MERKIFERFDSEQVTGVLLREAAELFSQNYGIWGEQAESLVGSFAKAGSRVRLSEQRLRAEYLPARISTYVRVLVNGRLAGNVFACRWTQHGRQICWITQLVVHRDYRERGLATGLLNELRQDEDDVYGIMGSHPAACLAAAKAFGSSINTIPLNFATEHAEAIIKASPIPYVANAKLCGTLFDDEDQSGMVSGVNTGFYVDHKEPLGGLQWLRQFREWPLGDLPEGHEFLLVIPAKRIKSRPVRQN